VLLALVLTTFSAVGIRVSSLKRVRRFCNQIATHETATVTLDDIRWATVVAGRHVPETTCLIRGVVAHTLCQRYGHESDLYVGVDRESETFAAHSWVESHDRVVVGDEVDLGRYEVLGVVAS
jgi:hypothetical protein